MLLDRRFLLPRAFLASPKWSVLASFAINRRRIVIFLAPLLLTSYRGRHHLYRLYRGISRDDKDWVGYLSDSWSPKGSSFSVAIKKNLCTSQTLNQLVPIKPFKMPSGTNSQGNNYNTPGGTNSNSGSSYHCKFVFSFLLRVTLRRAMHQKFHHLTTRSFAFVSYFHF